MGLKNYKRKKIELDEFYQPIFFFLRTFLYRNSLSDAWTILLGVSKSAANSLSNLRFSVIG